MAFFYILSLALVAGAAAQSCPSGLASSEVQSILGAHNKLRSSISAGQYVAKGKKMPAAKTAIPALTWDCGLEKSAQNWANRCEFKHSSVQGQGENLFTMWSSQKLSFAGMGSKACASWEDEFQKFGWSDVKLTMAVFNSGIGHATQMAAARSTKIGCGMASCQGGKQVLVVCQYKDAGNMLNSNIYDAR